MNIIRIDKSNGRKTRETLSRVKGLIQREYPDSHKQVFEDLRAGEREFSTDFATYRSDTFIAKDCEGLG